MEHEISALYDTIITKTNRQELIWSWDSSEKYLSAQVGELLVRIGGLDLFASERVTSNAMLLSLTAGVSRGYTIAVYDQEMRLVAKGVDRSSTMMNAMAAAQAAERDRHVEDISSPKIAQLGALLRSIYARHSIANRLLETLKAS
jgi:hypothetical protein